jgi:hypothetical protein
VVVVLPFGFVASDIWVSFRDYSGC